MREYTVNIGILHVRPNTLFLLGLLGAALALGAEAALDGADHISGGDGVDLLVGHGGADMLIGGRGGDTFNAQAYQTSGHPPGKDTVRAGRSNDTIYSADGVKDTIDCGPGVDYVLFDRDLDNCDRLREQSPGVAGGDD